MESYKCQYPAQAAHIRKTPPCWAILKYLFIFNLIYAFLVFDIHPSINYLFNYEVKVCKNWYLWPKGSVKCLPVTTFSGSWAASRVGSGVGPGSGPRPGSGAGPSRRIWRLWHLWSQASKSIAFLGKKQNKTKKHRTQLLEHRMYFPGITKQMKQVPKVVMSGKHQMKQTYIRTTQLNTSKPADR